MSESAFGKCCEHGQLARKCESCELEKMYAEADAKDKRIESLSADVDAFAAALVCRRNCHTCGGSGRVTGNTISYETDTEEERRDAWIMGSRRCPDCGQKPEAILAAHDAVKDKRIAELEQRIAELEQNESALRHILNETATGAADALTAICCKDERIAELEVALAISIGWWILSFYDNKGQHFCEDKYQSCLAVLTSTPQGQAAFDAARKVQS
jgi:uncharacterized coiled-coil protein SlyX